MIATRISFRTLVLAVLLALVSSLGLSLLPMERAAAASTATADKSPASHSVSSNDHKRPTSLRHARGSSEPPSCVGQNTAAGTGECADLVDAESHSYSSNKSKAVAVNGVKLTSKVTVLARIRANGTPKSQQTDCYRIPHAMSLWTSYNAEGTTGWHWKYYPAGYRFCRINGAVRDPICHNQVKIGVPQSQPPKNAIFGKVKFVKRLHWEAKAVASVDEKSKAVAKAWCTTATSYGYGEGSGSSAAKASASARMKGFVLTKLLAQVEARAQGALEAQLGGRSVTQVHGDVRAAAFAEATSEAHAKAVCKEIDHAPTGEIVQWPAHLYTANPHDPTSKPGEYRAKVVGSDPEDNGNVTLSVSVTGPAEIVVDAQHPLVEDIEGTNKVRYFWIRAKNTPGTATITLTVTDTTGNSYTTSKTFQVYTDEF